MFSGIYSLSSALMLHSTVLRNTEGCTGKVIGQIGYGLTAVVAPIETIVALAASALSLLAYPVSSTPLNYSTKWLRSSAFSIVWSIVDFYLNTFITVLVADERSAREIWQKRDIMLFPRNACTAYFTCSGNEKDFPGSIWYQRNAELFS